MQIGYAYVQSSSRTGSCSLRFQRHTLTARLPILSGQELVPRRRIKAEDAHSETWSFTAVDSVGFSTDRGFHYLSVEEADRIRDAVTAHSDEGVDESDHDGGGEGADDIDGGGEGADDSDADSGDPEINEENEEIREDTCRLLGAMPCAEDSNEEKPDVVAEPSGTSHSLDLVTDELARVTLPASLP